MRQVNRLVAAAGLVALCASASAAVLAPGSIATPTVQAPGPLPVATMNSGYNVGGTLVGTVGSYVVAGDPANPFGGLSFYYQLLNVGVEAVGRFTASDFDLGPIDVRTINVSWNGSVPGGTAPLFADRSVTGQNVSFDFLGAGQITSPGWSQTLVVHTAAKEYTTGKGGVIDNVVAPVEVFAPIPEPGAAMALGFAALTLLGKRHRH